MLNELGDQHTSGQLPGKSYSHANTTQGDQEKLQTFSLQIWQ